MFGSVRGGVVRVVEALTTRLGHAVHLNAPVTSLSRQPSGVGGGRHWRLTTHGAGRGAGDGRAGVGGGRHWRLTTPLGPVTADAVILAVPAWVAAELSAPHSPDAASILGGIGYADVVVLTIVLPAERVASRLDGSGFLVPRCEGMLTTACSWSSSKWEHYRPPGRVVLRISAGRADDRRWLGLSQADLIEALGRELAEFAMLDDPALLADAGGSDGHGGRTASGRADRDRPVLRITPWRRSLPQYRPGHLQRIDAVEAHLAQDMPGVHAVGAAFRGLGLPACVSQARAAAVKALGRL